MTATKARQARASGHRSLSVPTSPTSPHHFPQGPPAAARWAQGQGPALQLVKAVKGHRHPMSPNTSTPTLQLRWLPRAPAQGLGGHLATPTSAL